MGIQLSEAIREYDRHLSARRLAKNTCETRLRPVRAGLNLWGDLQLRSIHARHIDVLFSHYQWGPSTTNLYLGGLRLFFEWARAHKHVSPDTDPTLGWRNLRVPRQDKLRIPPQRFGELLDAADHPINRAVIALGLFTFMRGSEIATLRVADVEGLNGDTPLLKIWRHKTKEEDVLPVCRELQVELQRYLGWYAGAVGIPQSNWLLIPRRQYDGLQQRDRYLVDKKYTHPYRLAQKALAKLGYPTKGEGGHSLRRAGARALADELRGQGYDGALMRVASMLGHRDVRTTQHYIGWGLEREQRNEAFSGKTMFPSLSDNQSNLIDAAERFGG